MRVWASSGNSKQNDFTSEAIFNLACSILDNESVRLEILQGYKKLRELLGEPGVTERAAKEILNLIC